MRVLFSENSAQPPTNNVFTEKKKMQRVGKFRKTGSDFFAKTTTTAQIWKNDIAKNYQSYSTAAASHDDKKYERSEKLPKRKLAEQYFIIRQFKTIEFNSNE